MKRRTVAREAGRTRRRGSARVRGDLGAVWLAVLAVLAAAVCAAAALDAGGQDLLGRQFPDVGQEQAARLFREATGLYAGGTITAAGTVTINGADPKKGVSLKTLATKGGG